MALTKLVRLLEFSIVKVAEEYIFEYIFMPNDHCFLIILKVTQHRLDT